VRASSVDGNDTAAMSAFFAAVPAGTVHHMVCTWGESARCGDVRGAENFAKLQKQMAIKFDLQMRPVSMGADKVCKVPAVAPAPQSASRAAITSSSSSPTAAASCSVQAPCRAAPAKAAQRLPPPTPPWKLPDAASPTTLAPGAARLHA